MKISKDQKRKNHELLLRSAAKLARKKDFASVTMRSIAAEAKMSEAAIYNYFPTKEALLTAYLDWSLDSALEGAKSQAHWNRMNFTEKIHAVLESHLELLEIDKPFVGQVFGQLFDQTLPLSRGHLKATRKKYVALLEAELEGAVAAGEFQDPPFRGLICELLWDFHVGVIYYWLNDRSEDGIGTTRLIDMSLGIFRELLRGGLMNKAYALIHFLMKEHVLNKLFTAAKL